MCQHSFRLFLHRPGILFLQVSGEVETCGLAFLAQVFKSTRPGFCPIKQNERKRHCLMRPASKYLFFQHLFQVPICLYLGFQVPRFRPANWPTTRCMTFLSSQTAPPHLRLKNTFEKRHPQRHGSARPLCEMWTDGQENPGFYVLVKQGKNPFFTSLRRFMSSLILREELLFNSPANRVVFKWHGKFKWVMISCCVLDIYSTLLLSD